MEQFSQCQHIEMLVSQHKLVRSCIVVGFDQPYLSVFIAPDKAVLAEILRKDDPDIQHNLDTYRGLNHIDVRCYYCDLLEQVNNQLADKKIDRFALIDWEDFKDRDTLLAENKLMIESFYQEYLPGIG